MKWLHISWIKSIKYIKDWSPYFIDEWGKVNTRWLVSSKYLRNKWWEVLPIRQNRIQRFIEIRWRYRGCGSSFDGSWLSREDRPTKTFCLPIYKTKWWFRFKKSALFSDVLQGMCKSEGISFSCKKRNTQRNKKKLDRRISLSHIIESLWLINSCFISFNSHITLSVV